MEALKESRKNMDEEELKKTVKSRYRDKNKNTSKNLY